MVAKFDHFAFQKVLIEELIMFHASGGSSYSAGPNLDPSQGNFGRLVEGHFISQIPSTQIRHVLKENVFDIPN